jgi:hypothetical protein
LDNATRAPRAQRVPARQGLLAANASFRREEWLPTATPAAHADGMLGSISKRAGRRASITTTVLWLCCLTGCAHMTTGGAQKAGRDESGRVISEAELQEDVERFTGGFLDRLAQVLEPSDLPDSPELQEALFKRVLNYGASALDIAAGKAPGVNMLDMLVFMSLSRDTFEHHWRPKVFGAAGLPLLEALRRSEAELWETSGKVLSTRQQAQLVALMEDWKREHPDQVRMAFARLPALAQLASKQTERNEASGMLASVKAATRVGDQAVLLGDRAIFLALRMPFLLRLQGRVGAREMINDGVSFLGSQETLLGRTETLLARTEELVLRSSELVTRADHLGPMLGQLDALTRQADAATREAQLLAQSLDTLATRFEPLLSPRTDASGDTTTGLEAVLGSSNELTARTLGVLQEARVLMPSGPDDERWQFMHAQLDRTARRWMAYLALVGIVWTTFLWGGYYLVRRHAEPAPRRRRPRGPTPRGDRHTGPHPSSAE